MLSTQSKNKNTESVVINNKLIVPSYPSAEAKSPEQEVVYNADPTNISSKDEEPSNGNNENEINSTYNLSVRASKIKEELNSNGPIIDAVVLKQDGTSVQIKYNTTSNLKQANKILNGRPTIIGEFEEINVIVVRVMDTQLKQKSIKSNTHILPYPLCNQNFGGDYLLYRVNNDAVPCDFALDEYTKFVEKTKSKTAESRKHYNPFDDMEINVTQSLNSESKLAVMCLKSDVDKKVREEFKAKYNRNGTEDEISDSVNATINDLIENILNNNSPLNDPDYNPKDDEEAQQQQQNGKTNVINAISSVYKSENGVDIPEDELISRIESAQTLLETTGITVSDNDVNESVYRRQLDEALNYVRAKGRSDGQQIANMISETFVELNGNEPSLNQLTDIFRKIKNELSIEAEEDIAEKTDDGTAFYMAQKIGNFNEANPSDLIEYAFRIVGEDMVNRAISSFEITKGRKPTDSELQITVHELSSCLADEVIEFNKSVNIDKLNGIGDDDADYDPCNENDQSLAQQDYREDIEFEKDFDESSEFFKLGMLSTKHSKSKTGISETYDVYFCKFDKKRKDSNLKKAIIAFKDFNKREPNVFEIRHMEKFLFADFANTNEIKFKLSIDNENNENELKDDEELIVTGKAINISPPNEVTTKTKTTPSKVLVTPVKRKNAASSYDIYLDDQIDAIKNEEAAIKWFIRFNKCKPTKEEIDNIKKFVKADTSDLTAIKFNIEVSGDDYDDDIENEDDDAKLEEEPNDNDINNNIKTKTSSIVVNKNNKSTKYTLDFDEQEERGIGDKKQAIKWFKRFNQRKPTKDDIEKIKKFIETDRASNNNNNNDDTIDID